MNASVSACETLFMLMRTILRHLKSFYKSLIISDILEVIFNQNFQKIPVNLQT